MLRTRLFWLDCVLRAARLFGSHWREERPEPMHSVFIFLGLCEWWDSSSPLATEILQLCFYWFSHPTEAYVVAGKVSPTPSILVLVLMIVNLDGDEGTAWAENPLIFFDGVSGISVRVRAVNVRKHSFHCLCKFKLEHIKSTDMQWFLSP